MTPPLNCRHQKSTMGFPLKGVTPECFYRGPVRISPGFPLKACGNDGPLTSNLLNAARCWELLHHDRRFPQVLVMRIFRFAPLLLIFLAVTQIVEAAEAPKEKISVAYASISPSMSGIWMAKEIGAFDRQGLGVELVYISSGATAIQALVGGSVTAGP